MTSCDIKSWTLEVETGRRTAGGGKLRGERELAATGRDRHSSSDQASSLSLGNYGVAIFRGLLAGWLTRVVTNSCNSGSESEGHATIMTRRPIRARRKQSPPGSVRGLAPTRSLRPGSPHAGRLNQGRIAREEQTGKGPDTSVSGVLAGSGPAVDPRPPETGRLRRERFSSGWGPGPGFFARERTISPRAVAVRHGRELKQTGCRAESAVVRVRQSPEWRRLASAGHRESERASVVLPARLFASGWGWERELKDWHAQARESRGRPASSAAGLRPRHGSQLVQSVSKPVARAVAELFRMVAGQGPGSGWHDQPSRRPAPDGGRPSVRHPIRSPPVITSTPG